MNVNKKYDLTTKGLFIIYVVWVIIMAFTASGCKKFSNGCVRACYDDNIDAIKQGICTEKELIYNCKSFCNTMAIDTLMYADSK